VTPQLGRFEVQKSFIRGQDFENLFRYIWGVTNEKICFFCHQKGRGDRHLKKRFPPEFIFALFCNFYSFLEISDK